MPYHNWNATEIQNLKALTIRAGRPLEVSTAARLASRGWSVHLNTYYVDEFSEKARDLDVLAHRRSSFTARNHEFGLNLFLHVSCKGFAEGQFPISWSVLNEKASDLDQVLCATSGLNRGFILRLGQSAATLLVTAAGLNRHERMIGMRGCEKSQKDAFTIVRDRDNELYEGADSALKAALWSSREEPFSGIDVHIPLVVLSQRITNLLIDHGKINDPEVRPGGYITGLYPVSHPAPSSRWLLTLVWSFEDLSKLLDSLEKAQQDMGAAFQMMGLNPP